MMHRLRRFALAALVLAVSSCGGSQPPADTAADKPNVATGSDAPRRAEAPDLSPVEAPEHLFAVGRLRNPAGLVDTVVTWTQLPVDWRKLLESEQPGAGQVFDLEAPVETAVALDVNAARTFAQPLLVVSIGLTSVDKALEFASRHDYSVTQLRAGVHRVGGPSGPPCLVAASVGPTPARLVCGDRMDDVDALLPYVTRNLPKAQLGEGDLYLEVRAAPLREHYGARLRQLKTYALPFVLHALPIDHPNVERALADATHAVGDDLVALAEDLEQIQLQLFQHSEQVELRVGLVARRRSSWVVETGLQRSSEAGPAPESLWRLPRSANQAGYVRGGGPERLKPVRHTLAQLLDGWLGHYKVPRASRSRITELVEEVHLGEGPLVYGQGALPQDPDAEQTSPPVPSWRIVGMAGPARHYQDYFSRLKRALADRRLQKVLEEELSLERDELPQLRSEPLPTGNLPAGARRYRLRLPAPSIRPAGIAAESSAVELTLVLVPADDRTWLGISRDADGIVEQLEVVHEAEASQRLSSRSGLEHLRELDAVAAGFTSLRDVAHSMRLGLGRDVSRVLAGLPHQGNAPIPFAARVEKQDEGGRLEFSLRVPKAVFQDVAAAVPTMMSGIRF